MKDTFMNKLLDCTGVQAANSSKNTMNFNEFLIEHKKQQGKIKKVLLKYFFPMMMMGKLHLIVLFLNCCCVKTGL